MGSILTEDIRNKIVELYFGDQIVSATKILEGYLGPEQTRVVRCLLFLSQGDLTLLQANAQTANQDYRDIIFFAEYDAANVRVNNFKLVFK